MKLKQWLYLAGAGLLTLVAAACGNKAPELSFEETLKVYNKQNETFASLVSLMSSDGLSQTSTKGTISVNVAKQGEGKIVVDSESFTNPKTKEAEASVELNADANISDESAGIAGKVAAKLGLNVLIQDAKLFLKLSNLDITADEKNQQSIAMVKGMIEWFKGKWIKVDNQEFATLLETSRKSGAQKFDPKEFFTNDLYKNPTSTKYEGQPAWKVELDQEVLKQQIKKVMEFSIKNAAASLTGKEAQEFKLHEQELNAQLEKTLADLKIENTDTYFVIYGDDNVKWIAKNVDINLQGVKLNVQQSATADTSKGKITVTPAGEQSKSETILIDYTVKEVNKTKYDFTVLISDAAANSKVVKIEGSLALALSEKGFSIKPDFSVTYQDVTAKVQGEYKVNLIDAHTFTAPTDAIDAKDLLGGLIPGLASDADFSGDEEEIVGLEEVAPLTGAQAATRDTARQKYLVDLINAIEMYMATKGEYPAQPANGDASKLTVLVERGYLRELPSDPLKTTAAVKVGSDNKTNGAQGQFTYRLIKSKDGKDAGSYLLAARAESLNIANATSKMLESVSSSTTSKNFEDLCETITKDSSKATSTSPDPKTKSCNVKSEEDLRYVLVK